MIRSIIFLLGILLAWGTGFAQLTGIMNIPGDYSSVHNAIIALNAQGVGTGGVTFNLSSGYTEFFPSATSGLITATGTAANPILFRHNGTGAHPLITGAMSGGSNYDYVFALKGTDYITFDGIDVASWDIEQEWGYAILKESATNGAQHVTIKNCTITMNNVNDGSVGIYSANITTAAPQNQVVVTDVNGTNSSNVFSGNLIEYAYHGIMVLGYDDPDAPYTFYDRDNDIGGSAGNTVRNFGGSNTAAYGIYTRSQNLVTVRNNAVNGYVYGVADCTGIHLATANDASAAVSGNTVSIQYGGEGDFYGIHNAMGIQNHDNVVSLFNNSVTGCSYENVTTKNCYYIRNRGYGQTTNVYGNSVTDNTYGSAGTTATGSIFAVQASGGTPAVQGEYNVYNNTVSGNVRVQQVTDLGTTYYFQIGAQGNVLNVYGNVVDNNLVSAEGNTWGIEVLSASANKNIYSNTVTNIYNANGTLYGIYAGNGTVCRLHGNRVQNLHSNSSSSLICGINSSSLSSTGHFYTFNNIVGELYAPLAGGGGTPTPLVTGISLGGPYVSYAGCYNNTVFLDASSSSSYFSSAAIYLATWAQTYDLRNNIVVNLSQSQGNGVSVALWTNSATYPTLAAETNNNNYFAGVPSASRLVFYDGTFADQTLKAFQQRVWPRESHSISVPVRFVNSSVSPFDLHVDPNQPNEVESNGKIITTPLALNSDYDNQPRYPGPGYPDNPLFPATAPDMGADEFAGSPDDKTAPVILFEALMNTSETGNRTLEATITDPHGVPVSGAGLPRICWKKNHNGPWIYETGISAGNHKYNFVFGGGASPGDTISYFLVAQDQWTAPNVGAFPWSGAGGYSYDPPACSVPPTNAGSYVIVGSVCGTIHVGSGQQYPTLTAAINDLAQKHMSCPVTLLLTDNLYIDETYPLVIPRIAGASETNTLTIRPAAGATPFFQTYLDALTLPRMAMISLVSARHLIIDGSNSGGTDRSMTFQNLGEAGWAAALGIYCTNTDYASDIVVKNCVLKAHQDTILNAQGVSCYPLPGDLGFKNIEIRNNEINSAKAGLVLYGEMADRPRNIRIIDNLVGSMTAGQYVTNIGMTFSNIDSLLIEGNEVIGFVDGTAPTLSLLALRVNTGTSNVRVIRNIIHDWYHKATDAVGLYFESADNYTTTEISNNLIYNVKGPGVNQAILGANPCGIWIWSGRNFNIYHNTVFMSGNILPTNYATMTSCFGIGGNGTSNIITGVDLRNNIFKNSMQSWDGTGTCKTYAVVTNTPGCFTNIDHNDYFLNGQGPVLGYLGGDRPSLNDWRLATGQDVNSFMADPAFVSATDFHPTNSQMNNKGTYIPTVPRDFSGFLRTNPPDAGIYEFGADPVVLTTTASNVTPVTATLNGNVSPNNGFVSTWFDYGFTTSYGTSLTASPSLVTGFSPADISLELTSLTPGTTYHYRARGVNSDGLIIYGEDFSFTTGTITIPEDITVTGTIINGDTCFNAVNTITVAGGSSVFEVQAGTSVTMIAGNNILLLPGTTVNPGGYLHGYISGEYCNTLDVPSVAAMVNDPENPSPEPLSQLRIWPNPTTGDFTLELVGDAVSGKAYVEIFSILGDKVFRKDLAGAGIYKLSLSGRPSGIYIVRVISGSKTETARIIMQ